MTVKITQYGICCPRCKEIIFSNSRHDFVRCNCDACYIDGGFDYERIGYTDWLGVPTSVPREVNPITFKYFRDTQPKNYWTPEQLDQWFIDNPEYLKYKDERSDADQDLDYPRAKHYM